jgi:hypothetical protein
MITRDFSLLISHTKVSSVYYLDIIQRSGALFATPFDEIDVEFLGLTGHLISVGRT